MKFLLFALGTRGDSQPFIALSLALEKAGHDVTLYTPETAASLAYDHGVNPTLWSYPLTKKQRRVLAGGGIPPEFLTQLKTILRAARRPTSGMSAVLQQMATAGTHGADIVVYHPLVPGDQIAEKLGVPGVPVELQPTSFPTHAFTYPNFPIRLPRFFNRTSYRYAILLRFGNQGRISRWRQESLHLPLRRGYRDILHQSDGSNTTFLQAFSRHILPNGSNYPSSVFNTGYWFLPSPKEWAPPAGISEFISRDTRPISIGFGSLVDDPERTSRVVAMAIRSAGVRAIVCSGWNGLRREFFDDDNVFFVEDIPYDWLFPRTAAIVHHGGSGTTGAALAAGRPQVICPFLRQQAFFGRRMHVLGVSPAPQPAKSLSPKQLAYAIRQAACNHKFAGRAEELGHRVRAEPGVDAAVKVLEKLAGRNPL